MYKYLKPIQTIEYQVQFQKYYSVYHKTCNCKSDLIFNRNYLSYREREHSYNHQPERMMIINGKFHQIQKGSKMIVMLPFWVETVVTLLLFFWKEIVVIMLPIHDNFLLLYLLYNKLKKKDQLSISCTCRRNYVASHIS